ncbi:hypothetical protein BH20ACI4_BH20ACI4_07920 [soil metagenome]
MGGNNKLFMAIFKRYKGKKVERSDHDYDKGTWIAQGMVNGERYHKALKNVKNQKDAKAEEEFIRNKLRRGEYDLVKDNTKFSVFVDEIYLPYCQINNVNYGQKVIECNFLKKFFGNMLLKSILPKDIEEYKRWRSAQKVRCQRCLYNKHKEGEICNTRLISPKTVNLELSTLKRLLNYAIENHKLKKNPMKFVKMFRKPASRKRYLSDEEVVKLLNAARHNKRLLSIILIGLATGWRKGQILSVKKEHLDYSNQTVTLIRSKQDEERTVKVSDFVWKILQNLAEETKGDYLFYNEKTGQRLKDFKTAWWTALKKAGIEDFHFHDVRHSFATELLEVCGRGITVQTALGHSNIKTTEIYAHTKDDDLLRQLNKVGEKLESHYPIFTPSSESMKKDLQDEPVNPFLPGINWSGRDDLNIRPHGPEPCALPG